jgi:protein-tyrosine phosphatase
MPTDGPLIPTTFNSRDVGGRSAEGGLIRRGRLFRSDAPVRLDHDGATVLKRLGIRTAIDLREPVERELDPVSAEGLGLTVRHIPILGADFDLATEMSLADVYFDLLNRRGGALTAAVRALCEPGALPAVVFCSAGKDRTGLVTALTLGAIGARPDEIVADYALTERAMAGGFRAVIEKRAIAAGISEQELAIKVGAPPELMRSVLAWIGSRYDDATGFLREHGLTDADLDRLRFALLDPCAASAA